MKSPSAFQQITILLAAAAHCLLSAAAAPPPPPPAPTSSGSANGGGGSPPIILGDGAGSTEEALSQMTMGLHALGAAAAAGGGSASGGAASGAFGGGSKLDQAFERHVREVRCKGSGLVGSLGAAPVWTDRLKADSDHTLDRLRQ
jgi:hypothetical protein